MMTCSRSLSSLKHSYPLHSCAPLDLSLLALAEATFGTALSTTTPVLVLVRTAAAAALLLPVVLLSFSGLLVRLYCRGEDKEKNSASLRLVRAAAAAPLLPGILVSP